MPVMPFQDKPAIVGCNPIDRDETRSLLFPRSCEERPALVCGRLETRRTVQWGNINEFYGLLHAYFGNLRCTLRYLFKFKCRQLNVIIICVWAVL